MQRLMKCREADRRKTRAPLIKESVLAYIGLITTPLAIRSTGARLNTANSEP